MSKRHNPTKPCQPYQPRAVKIVDRAGDELTSFPMESHVITGRQREIPNPAAAVASIAPGQEDLQVQRRRPLGAPMATRIGDLPDPIAAMAWDAVVDDVSQTTLKWWDRWSFTAALAIWSAACFLLGTLV